MSHLVSCEWHCGGTFADHVGEPRHLPPTPSATSQWAENAETRWKPRFSKVDGGPPVWANIDVDAMNVYLQ